MATRQFLRRPEDSPNQGHGHHWYGNGESYLRIGDALGRAVAGAIVARTRPTIPAGEDPLRWRDDVTALAAAPPGARHPVVFVGSSSIRGWRTLANDMADLPVRNHGFGGSRLFDTTYWLEELVVRHDPSVVVVFAGTNDIAGANPRPTEWVADRFDELVVRLRALGCAAPLVYIAITPTPGRAEHLALVHAANAAIAARCARDPRLHFVDTAAGMLSPDGQPDPQWFGPDRMHLNEAGYRHWTQLLRPVVARLHATNDR